MLAVDNPKSKRATLLLERVPPESVPLPARQLFVYPLRPVPPETVQLLHGPLLQNEALHRLFKP